MILDQGSHGLLMKMRNRRVCMAAGGDAEGTVLDTLQGLKGGLTRVRRPDGGGIVQLGFDVGLIRFHQRLLWAAPSSSGDGAKDAELSATGSSNILGVAAEAEVGVEGDA